MSPKPVNSKEKKSIQDLFFLDKNIIVEEMNRRLSSLGRTTHIGGMLNTDEGRRLLENWVELTLHSLGGEPQKFYAAQKEMGYLCAVQGFSISEISDVYMTFQHILLDMINEKGYMNQTFLFENRDQIRELYQVLFRGYTSIINSFAKICEENIEKRSENLKYIQGFTKKVVSAYGLDEIANVVLTNMKAPFSFENCLIAIYYNQRITHLYPADSEIGQKRPISTMIKKTIDDGAVVFLDSSGRIFDDIHEAELKAAVSIPIKAHGRCYGCLILSNFSKPFVFSIKELAFLKHLVYIIAPSFENAFMMNEIEEGDDQRRFLAGKIITIQEEERRRLGADIHDSLAQELAGIGYKVQFCRELIKKSKEPARIVAQLDSLSEAISMTIDQSRHLIFSLRPEIIDQIALFQDLNRYAANFTRETGIQIKTRFSDNLQLSTEMSICLFRIAQEALTNTQKHAGANSVDIVVEKTENEVALVITDNGKGFVFGDGISDGQHKTGVGLLTMRERVEAKGGRLQIDSAPNKGCRIKAIIPLESEEYLDEP